MNEFNPVRIQSCTNQSCAFYGQKLLGNIVFHSRIPKRFRCKICKKTWVVNRYQMDYGLRTNLEKIMLTSKLIEQGLTIRSIAQHLSVSPTTIQRWKYRIQNHKKFNF